MTATSTAAPLSTLQQVRVGDDARFGHLMVSARADAALAHLSTRALHRRVRRFLLTDLADRDLVGYVIGYADPTGEAAVRNVMRAA